MVIRRTTTISSRSSVVHDRRWVPGDDVFVLSHGEWLKGVVRRVEHDPLTIVVGAQDEHGIVEIFARPDELQYAPMGVERCSQIIAHMHGRRGFRTLASAYGHIGHRVVVAGTNGMYYLSDSNTKNRYYRAVEELEGLRAEQADTK